MIDPAQAPRWQLRLMNYSRALASLRHAVELGKARVLSDLEKAGVVQTFEIAWELGWKLMADYLTESLAPPEEYTPTKTIRAAMAAAIVTDGDAWIAAGRARNVLSHTYSESARDRLLTEIGSTFLPPMVKLEAEMHARVT